MASSAGSAQTADSPETAMVPWQPSREDAVPLGPPVDLNPFWSEKAKEEAQLKALRPKDLPEVEEEQGSLVSPGALPGARSITRRSRRVALMSSSVPSSRSSRRTRRSGKR